MKIFKQLFWLFFFVGLGEGISLLIKPFFPLPASVIGMIILFLALHNHWLGMDKVDQVGTWLTDNMAIFFVPAGVGLITNLSGLLSAWWQIGLIVIVSLVVTLISVGKLVQSMNQQTTKE